MSDTPHLRQTTRDLYAAAEEIRADELPEVKQEREQLKQRAIEEYGTPEEAPMELHQQFQQLTQQIRELAGTADTYEHYADEWSDGTDCTFTLEEFNGDEYAQVIDAVSAEAARQREDGTIPEGFGQVKALEYGVTDKPPGAPADPGMWPAPIVTELYDALESITAPPEVDLGNESLASAMREDGATTLAPASKQAPPET